MIFSLHSSPVPYMYIYIYNYIYIYIYISYYIILYHIISYYIILYHIISYYIILYHIISYYIILYHKFVQPAPRRNEAWSCTSAWTKTVTRPQLTTQERHECGLPTAIPGHDRHQQRHQTHESNPVSIISQAFPPKKVVFDGFWMFLTVFVTPQIYKNHGVQWFLTYCNQHCYPHTSSLAHMGRSCHK